MAQEAGGATQLSLLVILNSLLVILNPVKDLLLESRFFAMLLRKSPFSGVTSFPM